MRATTGRSNARVGGLSLATAEPRTLLSVGATEGITATDALATTAGDTRTAALPTGCDCTNVVVGNYIYSLLLGMSVPDVSGKAIANLEVESLRHIAPTFHGDTIYGETRVLEKTESKSKDDRGIVYVETQGYKQDGTVVCVFRRKVMVPKISYGQARGGEQPGRPLPAS